MSVQTLSRTLVNKFLVRPLPKPYCHEGGDCYSVPLPALRGYADDESNPRRSTLTLYEDGLPLHQPHFTIGEIRGLGIGRYAHWEGRLYFSSTDNTNPNKNGRRYEYSISPWLYKRRVERPELDPGLPINHRKRDSTDAKIREDVAYALSTGGAMLHSIRKLGVPLAGKTVMEIGPGINVGVSMMLAAHGAKPVVVDRFLAPWDGDYHGRFYDMLRQELIRTNPAVDPRPLAALIEARGYPESIIQRVSASLEKVPLPDGYCDFVWSNAVLEHLYNLDASFAQLYRVTKPGGHHLHQVDFRDHRNFNKPLEYLMFSDETFHKTFEKLHSDCGNRWRPEEMTERLVAAGFEIVELLPTEYVRPEYFRGFLPRLRISGSRYQHWPEDRLQILGGRYTLRRPDH
jgi:hypothetical protein